MELKERISIIIKKNHLKQQEAFKVLIFIAGMEAEKAIDKQGEVANQRNPTKQLI